MSQQQILEVIIQLILLRPLFNQNFEQIKNDLKEARHFALRKLLLSAELAALMSELLDDCKRRLVLQFSN